MIELTTLQFVCLVILILDVGILIGYFWKVIQLNRFLIKKKGIKPKDFWGE